VERVNDEESDKNKILCNNHDNGLQGIDLFYLKGIYEEVKKVLKCKEDILIIL
jgi:hypothetical protein